jgi:hypothetical protein
LVVPESVTQSVTGVGGSMVVKELVRDCEGPEKVTRGVNGSQLKFLTGT